jgi:hypothetical protein
MTHNGRPITLREAALLTKGVRAVAQLIARAAENGEHHGVIADAAWLIADINTMVEGAIERPEGLSQ